jgi:hypothetical protein
MIVLSLSEMSMLNELQHGGIEDSGDPIRHHSAAPPVVIPAGYVGPVVLPGNGRLVWWTGRVAIGLRHQPTRMEAITESALWVQSLMLGAGRGAAAA